MPVPEGYSNRYPSTYGSFLPEWWHYCGSVSSTLAADNRSFVPTFYGTHALEMAIFYNSSEGLVQDVAVHGFTALAATSLGVPSLRKSMLA